MEAEPYGFEELPATVDAILTGRNTYEDAMTPDEAMEPFASHRQPAVSSRPERPGFSLNPFASSHSPRAR